MRCFIGWDSRETLAYQVAADSFARQVTKQIPITPIKAHNVKPMLWRTVENRKGQMWDVVSDAPMSTEFAISRFLVPHLARGWALFVDCDVVFLSDPVEIFALADDRYALMCVQHPDYAPTESVKMDGQAQTSYARKNWSSVMLWNCDHPANASLTIDLINSTPGRDLHRFCWLHDDEIGELPAAWNWLVGVQPKPEVPRLAHFTLGGPWIPGWQPKEHDEIWTDALSVL